jgi:hypothetical protein
MRKIVACVGVALMLSAVVAPGSSAAPSQSAAPVAAGYTMERVKANGTSSIYWTVISGNVFVLQSNF